MERGRRIWDLVMGDRAGLIVGAGLLLLAAAPWARAGAKPKEVRLPQFKRRPWTIEDIVIEQERSFYGPQYGPMLGGNPAGCGGSLSEVQADAEWDPSGIECGGAWVSVLGDMISNAPDPSPVWVPGRGWRWWSQNGQKLYFPYEIQSVEKGVAIRYESDVYPSFGGVVPFETPPESGNILEIENGVAATGSVTPYGYLQGRWFPWFQSHPGDVFMTGIWVCL